MNQGIKTIIYPVRDVARAKALFSKLLGTGPSAESPYYVGFMVGDQEIGLDPYGHDNGMTGPLAFYHVDDIRQTLRSLVGAGAPIEQEIRDVGGGKLVASVTDPDGNTIGLIQMP